MQSTLNKTTHSLAITCGKEALVCQSKIEGREEEFSNIVLILAIYQKFLTAISSNCVDRSFEIAFNCGYILERKFSEQSIDSAIEACKAYQIKIDAGFFNISDGLE